MFKTASRERWIWLCLAAVAVWYPVLTCLLGYPPSTRLDFGLAFNSMAEHLLMGRFDVDPDAIGSEGFDIGDRTVSYFGIFCALLRLPLVLVPGLAKIDITWWSCQLGALIAAYFQVRAIALVWTPASPPRQVWLGAGLLITVLFGSQHIQFLRPSIYQEPINWGFCHACAFIFLAMRGFIAPRGFDRGTLCWMAVCAGLALLTRGSFGVGLYAAFGLFLLARGHVRAWPAPVCILLIFMVLTGIVNEGRWGNPLVFADFSLFNLSQDVTPDRLGRYAAYGSFNPARLWLGLSYYFLPIWTWVRTDGHVLFAETQATLMDAMELPPGSFFVTDPFLLGLAAAGVFAIRDRARAALLLGLLGQALLILCAIGMSHRYRAEFYPLLFLAGLFGAAAPARSPRTTPDFRASVIVSVAIGVVASNAMAVISARSPWGPGEFYLERYGLIGTYLGPRP
jgi:hypothetical protein